MCAGVGRLEGRRPLWRHWHWWKDNIKIVFKEMDWMVWGVSGWRQELVAGFVKNGSGTLGPHQMRGISWLNEELLTCQGDI
jgi:hypothetical protein